MPAAAVDTASLSPPPAALRAAATIDLTGRELGGLWKIQAPPLELWRSIYAFTPEPEWLARVQASTVRFGAYCTAAVVSPDGLILTTHHCALPCIEANSGGKTDYVAAGFVARSRSQEIPCPRSFVDQLISTDDVTARIAAATSAYRVAGGSAQPQAEIARVEAECAAQHKLECRVVTSDYGQTYELHRYRRHGDIRLVFAPELRAAFFGGHEDNFTYPRYALDIAVLRIEDFARSDAASFLPLRQEPVAEGELVLAAGYPRGTARIGTVSQLLYEARFHQPFMIDVVSAEIDLLREVAAQGGAQGRRLHAQLFDMENALKGHQGHLAGLRDSLFVATRIRMEQAVQERIRARPELHAEYGDVWDRIAELDRARLEIAPRYSLGNPGAAFAPHLVMALQLGDYLYQSSLPEQKQTPFFRAQRAQLEKLLWQQRDTDPELAVGLLAAYLEVVERWLAPSDPLRTGLLRPNESPAAAAERLAATSRILDPKFRAQLLEGGDSAVQASHDPLVRYALSVPPLFHRIAAEWASVNDAADVQQQRLAAAVAAVLGGSSPPDASATLRISDGVVKRYVSGGTLHSASTTFYGMFDRAASFDGAEPWALPKRFEQSREHLDMAMPLNFVSTNDIAAGSSGSPVLDRDGLVVGLVFDNNLQALPNKFIYTDVDARAVSVHTSALLEALRSVYHGDWIAKELLGGRK